MVQSAYFRCYFVVSTVSAVSSVATFRRYVRIQSGDYGMTGWLCSSFHSHPSQCMCYVLMVKEFWYDWFGWCCQNVCMFSKADIFGSNDVPSVSYEASLFDKVRVVSEICVVGAVTTACLLGLVKLLIVVLLFSLPRVLDIVTLLRENGVVSLVGVISMVSVVRVFCIVGVVFVVILFNEATVMTEVNVIIVVLSPVCSVLLVLLVRLKTLAVTL